MQFRTAVITPYFKENRELLARCLRSVKEQTVAADHILVADGHPQEWIDAEPVRHIKLDRSHGDYGNTPRGLGALLAAAESYDAICFLDADNWFNNDHLEACFAAAAAKGNIADCDLVIAQRVFRRPDESIMPIKEEKDHVDKNCFFFLPGSFHLLSRWLLMSQELSSIGDRIFYKSIRNTALEFAYVNHPTVNYLNMWAFAYHALKEVPPLGAKSNVDMRRVGVWIKSRTPRDQVVDMRMMGVKLTAT